MWLARRTRFLPVAGFIVVLFAGALLACGGMMLIRPMASSSSLSAAPAGSPSRVPASHDPLYKTARVRYARRDYAGAITAIDALLADPSRTEADRVFLRRQREICQQSLTGGSPAEPAAAKTAHVSAPVPVPAPVSVPADCGPRALLLVCRETNPSTTLPNLSALSKTAGVTAPKGASLEGMAKAAASVGFAPLAVQMDRDALSNLSTPALAWVDGNHYLAVFQVNRSLRGIAYDTVTVQDPNEERKETIGLTTLLSRSGGVLLTLPKTTSRA